MTFRAYFSSSASPFSRFARGVRSAWPHAMHAILPNACALCGNLSHSTLCPFCDESYWNESALRCRVCAEPLTFARREQHASYRCADCVVENPPFDATFALADYRAPLDTLALGLKFRAQLVPAREFARHLHALVQDTWRSADCPMSIAPVPLSKTASQIERGYNQAWAIARAAGSVARRQADPMLVRRTIETAPQSRLDLDTRRLNVGRAFAVTGESRTACRHRRRRNDVRRDARSARPHAQGSRRAARDEFRRVAHAERLTTLLLIQPYVQRRSGRTRNSAEYRQRDPPVRKHRRATASDRAARLSARRRQDAPRRPRLSRVRANARACDWDAFIAKESPEPTRMFAFTTRGSCAVLRARLRDPATGSCSAPKRAACPTRCSNSFPNEQRVRLPMRPGNRSLNLSNTVAVVVFEAWRQTGFDGGA